MGNRDRAISPSCFRESTVTPKMCRKHVTGCVIFVVGKCICCWEVRTIKFYFLEGCYGMRISTFSVAILRYLDIPWFACWFAWGWAIEASKVWKQRRLAMMWCPVELGDTGPNKVAAIATILNRPIGRRLRFPYPLNGYIFQDMSWSEDHQQGHTIAPRLVFSCFFKFGYSFWSF